MVLLCEIYIILKCLEKNILCISNALKSTLLLTIMEKRKCPNQDKNELNAAQNILHMNAIQTRSMIADTSVTSN